MYYSCSRCFLALLLYIFASENWTWNKRTVASHHLSISNILLPVLLSVLVKSRLILLLIDLYGRDVHRDVLLLIYYMQTVHDKIENYLFGILEIDVL